VIGLTFALYVFQPAPGQTFAAIDSRRFLATPDGGGK
jgi:hypothetical protein